MSEISHSQPVGIEPATQDAITSVRSRSALRSLFAFRGTPSPSLEIAIGVATAVLVLGGWEICSSVGVISPQFLPSPSRVSAAMWTMFEYQHLAWHAWVSIARVWIAFLIAAVMAVPIGILMSSYRIVGASLEPLID